MDIKAPKTDAQGHSEISIDASALKLPETTLPLRADITVSVAEPGGRATETRTSLPVTTRGVLLGLKPQDPGGALQEGHAGSVAAAAFAADGRRIGLRAAFRLMEEVTEFHYFREGNTWQWKTTTFDRPVSFGSIDIPATEGGAQINLPPLDWGTYRLEIDDKGSGAFTSVKLHAGFSEASDSGASPEKVGVTLISPPPRQGGEAKLHINPPFAG